jgi:glycosyltransferase involved in cell wall biosynthesis
MKVLAGIPTRKRNTSGKIADVLAKVCDEVLVISQGATCIHTSNNVLVIERDENYGLVKARNEILKFAMTGGYDVVVQSDDDLSYKSEMVDALVHELMENPNLGAIASASRAYFNWDKDTECSKNFLLTPCAPQLWAARTDILRNVGFWDLEYLEDRDYGARMWKLGYAIGMLHKSIDLTHNPFIARTSESNAQGGQEKGESRYDNLGLAIQVMQRRHSDIMTIRQSEYGQKGRTFSTRYNWSKLLSFPVERFGLSMGYEDSKGRKL